MRRALSATAAALAVIFAGSCASASAAASAVGSTGVAQTVARNHGHIVRFNVGATHSPQLERMMTRPAIPASVAARSRPSTLASSASTIEGIDVASFQHPNGAPIDWTQVAAAQYKFAFIKVTEGSYYANPYYASDASGAKSAGMFEAPYAFAIPNFSGGALQADYALDHANYAADGMTLPLILDIEYDPYSSTDGTNECYGLTQSQMVAWISAFVTEANRRTGELPVIYTTADWWTTCTGDSAAFVSDPLWIASWDISSPTLPAAWSGTWAYWQYTDSASVPGIQAKTDASWLSASAIELAAPGRQSDQTGSQISRQFNALDGAGATTFTASGLPGGLQLDASTGALTGQITANPSPFPVSVTASGPGSVSATKKFTWDVHGSVSLGSLSSRTNTVGSPVLYQVPASDGLTGCTLRFSATGLPSGLAMSSCGLISGWPTVGGHYTVQVQVTDSSDQPLATGSFTWTVMHASASGPAGHIVLNRDGKCLSALSATSIAIETCGSASSERWTVAADGSLHVGTSCLAAKSASSTSPAALELTSCTNAQRWQAESNAVLINVGDGRCLADTGTKNGVLAVAAICEATWNKTGSASTPSPNQQWILPAGPFTSGIPGYCASNVLSSGQPGGVVTLRLCNGTSAQAWTLEHNGALSLGGECLGLTSSATAPGTRVELGTCISSAATQVWQLVGGPIGVEIFNPAAGLCLADPGDSKVAGTELVIGPCVTGVPGIMWRVS